jgi:hypothetical protein
VIYQKEDHCQLQFLGFGEQAKYIPVREEVSFLHLGDRISLHER